MAASRLLCSMCGVSFYGRADARYCSAACRQKAHRIRRGSQTADTTVRLTDAARTRAKAQQVRQQARAAREKAEATRESLAAARRRVETSQRRPSGRTASPETL